MRQEAAHWTFKCSPLAWSNVRMSRQEIEITLKKKIRGEKRIVSLHW